MTKAILSYQYPSYIEKLQELSFETIGTQQISALIPYEQRHADMQCLIIDDTAFVLKECTELSKRLRRSYEIVFCGEDIQEKYPHNIVLNALYLNHTLIGNLSHIDIKVLSYCHSHGYRTISVNQGYAKCSCAVAGDNALITADKGIYKTLMGEGGAAGLDVLLIEQGDIRLEGADCGFIGGASGYHDGKLYFCGNPDTHPDAERIREFCNKYHTEIIALDDGQLTDIGGIIFC